LGDASGEKFGGVGWIFREISCLGNFEKHVSRETNPRIGNGGYFGVLAPFF
jgi:hypothetical protein